LRHPRFHLHVTPTYSSWINQVERWFAALTDKPIRRGSHRSTRALEDAIRLCLATYDAEPKPFVWVKTADDILASIARFALRTSETGHELGAEEGFLIVDSVHGKTCHQRKHDHQCDPGLQSQSESYVCDDLSKVTRVPDITIRAGPDDFVLGQGKHVWRDVLTEDGI